MLIADILPIKENGNFKPEGRYKMKLLKVGLVGTNFGAYWVQRDVLGGSGKNYVEIAAVCSLDLESAKSCAEKIGSSRYVTDMEELLQDPGIDTIALFTPPAGRAALIERCINAGKAVITTKPFEEDSAETLRVLSLARSKNSIVHINSPSPIPGDDLAVIFDWQKKYDLGKPLSAYWENYARYYDKADGRWLESPEHCPVAPIFRIGIYGINDLIRIFGKFDHIDGTQSHLFTGRPTPDHASIMMRFQNGGIAMIHSSLCIGDGQPYPAHMILHFERGTVRRTFWHNGTLERNADFSCVKLELNCISENEFHSETQFIPPERRSGGYLWKEFYDAVTQNHPLPNEVDPETVAEGIRAIERLKELQHSFPC